MNIYIYIERERERGRGIYMYVQRSKEIEAQILFRKQKQKTKNLRQRDKHGFKNYTGGKTVLASGSQFNLVFGRFLPFLPNQTDTRLN